MTDVIFRRAIRLTKLALALLLLAATLAGCDFGSTPAVTPTVAPTVAATSTPTGASIEAPTETAAQPSPTLAAPAGDGAVQTDKLFHDSRDPQFRTPSGAVQASTPVTLRLRTAPGDLTAASIRVWDTRKEAETIIPMKTIAPDMWEGTVPTPHEPTALWYRFIVSDGAAKSFYNDDQRLDGGVGEGKGYESDTDYVITAFDSSFTTPGWVRDAVVYQIFPDRFNNGDPSNDKPAGSFVYGGETTQAAWGESPKGGRDFFGGDLKGVTAKLDYLKSLGVTVIWLNPVFASPSNHRYDTSDYTQIDPALGTLDDFKELVAKAKEAGIRIVLDGVFNHASSDSVYFDKFSRYPNDGAFESQQSPYSSWFTFQRWPDKYRSWQNIDTLPVFTEAQAVKDFFFSGPDAIVRRWTSEGIGGWRLDAAEQKSHDYWRDLRAALKEQEPEAVMIGEFWHNSSPWLAGDQWDGTMNYRFRDAVIGWLANPARDVEVMVDLLDGIREDYPPQALAASFNLIDSHDTVRALTEASIDKAMLRMMALMQFTWPGMPTIYYGDEAGLEGSRDPDNRRTYPWGSEDNELVDYYRTLAAARSRITALRTGDYTNLMFDNKMDVYAYARHDQNGTAVVVLNRSNEERTLTVPIKSIAPDGTAFENLLALGMTYTVQSGSVQLTVAPKSGMLLAEK